MAVENLSQFTLALTRAAERLPAEGVVKLQKTLVFEALSRLVQRTPVLTGRARSNWQVTIGQPSESQVGIDTATGTVTRGTAALAQLPPYQIVWISNNVPYIQKLEMGSSKQAPAGMVAVTVAELQQVLPS